MGLELLVLLVLGFSLGVVFFMYWSARDQLTAVEANNRYLRKKMMENDSEAKALEYNKRLVQSDLEHRRQEEDNRQEELSRLTEQVEELREQLVGDEKRS